MDFIRLSDNGKVLYGLSLMLEAAIGPHDMIHSHVDVPTALLVIEAAKRAEDSEDWFPRGKWATIQAVQSAIEKQLATLFATPPAR